LASVESGWLATYRSRSLWCMPSTEISSTRWLSSPRWSSLPWLPPSTACAVTPVLSLGDPVSGFDAHADRMHSGNSGKTPRMLIGNGLPSCIRVDAPVRRAVYHHRRSLLCVDVAHSLSQIGRFGNLGVTGAATAA